MVTLIDIDNFKHKNNVRFVLNMLLIACLFVALIVGTILCLLFSNLNYTLNLIINIVASVLILVFLIFYFLNIFPVVNHYRSFYKNLNKVSLEHRRRMVYVKEIEKKEISGVFYRVLQFSYKEGESEFIDNIYILDSDVSFIPEQPYKLITYHNVVIEYEAL